MVEQKPDDVVRSQWLTWAAEMMLADRRPEAPSVTLALQTGDQPITIELSDGAVRAHLGSTDRPDAMLAGPARPIMGLLLGLLELDDAKAVGVSFEGDPAVLERIGADAIGS
jgi:hypothetical protein